MAKKPEAEIVEEPTDLGTAPAGTEPEPNDEQPLGMGGVLMLRQVAPMDWIMAHVVPKGKGHKEVLAHVVGRATGYEVTKGNLKSDPDKESIKLTGAFSLESYITGEVTEGHTIYLPDNVSRRVMGSLQMAQSDGGDNGVIMDVAIGVRNTGMSIPYEWLAWSYVKDKASEMLSKMRAATKRRDVSRLVSSSPKMLEGKAE